MDYLVEGPGFGLEGRLGKLVFLGFFEEVFVVNKEEIKKWEKDQIIWVITIQHG